MGIGGGRMGFLEGGNNSVLRMFIMRVLSLTLLDYNDNKSCLVRFARFMAIGVRIYISLFL